MKAFIYDSAALPDVRLARIERIVGHHHIADTCYLQHPVEMFREMLRGEKRARFPEVRGARVKAECAQDCDDALRGFGERRVLHEESLPDKISLLRLVHLPKVFGRDLA